MESDDHYSGWPPGYRTPFFRVRAGCITLNACSHRCGGATDFHLPRRSYRGAILGGPGRNQTDLSKGANLARPLGTCGPRIEFVVSQRPPSFRRILPVLTSPGRLEVRGSSSYLTVAVLPDSNRCLKRFSKPLFHCIHAHNKTWLFR